MMAREPPGAARHAPAAAPPTFRVGAVDDAAEREADAVADRVLRRKCDACEEERLSRSATGGTVAGDARSTVGAALSSSGQPLRGEGAGLAARMGADPGRVRIHDGPAADRAARSVGARAFALGQNIVFARGEYRPGEEAGRRLLAHEIAHTMQSGAVLRREDKPGEKEDDPGKTLVEGLKIAAEQASKSEAVKKKIIEPVKEEAKDRWEELSPGEKGATIGFGAVTYGLGLGAMLGSEEGQKTLSGVNLLAPTALIPYWPLTKFSFKPPEDATKPYSFTLGFDGDDILKAMRERWSWLPVQSLSLEAGWTLDPTSDDGRLTTLKGKIGLAPGIDLSGGLMKGPLLTGPLEIGTRDDRTYMLMRTLPEEKDERPNIGFMLNVDLLKAPILPKRWRDFLGGAPERAP